MIFLLSLYLMTLDQIKLDIINLYPLDTQEIQDLSVRIIAEDPTIEGFNIILTRGEPNSVWFYRHRPVVLCEKDVLKALALNWLAETRKSVPRVVGDCSSILVYFGEFSGDLNNDGFVDNSDLAILSLNQIEYGVFPKKPLDEGPPPLENLIQIFMENE